VQLNIQTALKVIPFGNGQIVLNDLTAVRVTVGKGGMYCMTEKEGYANPTYFSWYTIM